MSTPFPSLLIRVIISTSSRADCPLVGVPAWLVTAHKSRVFVRMKIVIILRMKQLTGSCKLSECCPPGGSRGDALLRHL